MYVILLEGYPYSTSTFLTQKNNHWGFVECSTTLQSSVIQHLFGIRQVIRLDGGASYPLYEN